MTKEEFEKFVAGDARIAAVVRGTKKAPKGGEDAVLWTRGQAEEVEPERWDETNCWLRPERSDCMLSRLDWWMTGRR